MSDEREEVFGVEVDGMYDGHVVLEVIVLVKVIDEEGHECWVSRGSKGLSDPERYGILMFEAKRIEDFQVQNFKRDDDDDAAP